MSQVIHGCAIINQSMYYEGKMIDRTRDKESGKFIQKSNEKRKVRSIRLTDKTYNYLKEKAENNGQTIADLIERIVEDNILESKNESLDKATFHKLRDKALKSLPYGSQSKYYKECKKVFDKFINQVLHGDINK